MKIVSTTDWHPDAVTAGFLRYEDVKKAVDRSVDYALDVHAEVYLFEGDLITNDPKLDLMIRCLGLAQYVAQRCDDNGVTSIWMNGNHDVFEDGLGTSVLDPIQYSRGAIHVAEPSLQRLTDDGKFGIFLPYTPIVWKYDPVKVLQNFALTLAEHEAVVLIAGHLMLEGIERGSESEDMARGRDVFFPIDEAKRLFPKAILTNGHYHRQQVFRDVHVPGSIVGALTRGEVGNEPSLLVFTV